MTLTTTTLWLLSTLSVVLCRIHDINIVSDRREIIPLSNFGLTTDGFIDLFMTSLIVNDNQPTTYGIVMENSQTQTSSQYMENHINICRPESMAFYDKHPRILNMEIELNSTVENSVVRIKDMKAFGSDWDYDNIAFSDLLLDETARATAPLSVFSMAYTKSNSSYAFHVMISVNKPADEGQYTLYFYRCPKPLSAPATIDYTFSALIVQKNGNSYLSAGEKPLTLMYCVTGLVYLGLTWVWVKVMLYHSSDLFKIHYLMASLVFAKFLASVLHSIDYYYIGSEGTPEEAWAILWYIIHLVRGMLLFISLALIGMGFAFVKHVLSSNEKLVLMTVVPLQIIANVAYVIIDSSEEAELNYGTWKKILIFVDLLCCGAIIFPVMWSIRHLQQATERSDNKTNLILSQLKLFRQFYVLVVIYIYITRIALKFMEVVLPFRYTWSKDFMDELATIAFFVITGWKFRPYVQNPYYKIVDEEEDEMEMDSLQIESDTLRSRNNIPAEDEA